LIVHHSPAKALHGAKVHRHRLRGPHASISSVGLNARKAATAANIC
jgi:hypothetical protein